jgi:hypothetical protein
MWHFRIVRVQLESELDEVTLPADWEPFQAEPATESGAGWVVYLRQDDTLVKPPT